MSAGLQVQNLTVRFGGLVAVDDVSFHAPLDRVTGLIGPNGAGKSTTFNACSGLNTPTAGTVTFDGVEISDAPPDRRARLGIGRTFQHLELFDSATVARNVRIGAEARHVTASPWRHLVARRHEMADDDDRTSAAIAQCGLEHLADRKVGGLSTGQRRLVELARALAGDFRLLLLDEVSSGLDKDETDAMGDVLEAVAATGVGVLLVEHDMSMVMRLCDHIYVLEFGKLIFGGTPAEVRGSERVQRAYLGSTSEDVA